MRVALLPLLIALGCAGDTPAQPTSQEEAMPALSVTSPAFEAGQRIPKKHTCEGADASPALTWSGVPAGTRAIALIVDDPDAPVGNWNHWVLWNLPADATGLSEGSQEGTSGHNDFRRSGYGGPCPPPGHGDHRYFFKVFALDTPLDLPPTAKKKQLEAAMEGHVLSLGELMGTYSRG